MWKKLLIMFVVILSVVTAILVFSLIIASSSGKILFISFKPGCSIKIDKSKLTTYTTSLRNTLGFSPQVFVVVSSKFKQTETSTGWGNANAVFYGEWSKKLGWNVFSVYIDEREKEKLSSDILNKLLNYFITGEINTFYNLGRGSVSVGNIFIGI